MTVHHLEPTMYYFTFAPNPPALTIKSGDSVITRTRDAGGFNERNEPLPTTRNSGAMSRRYVQEILWSVRSMSRARSPVIPSPSRSRKST